MPRTLRIAMLNASCPPLSLLARVPTWGRIFHFRLVAANPDITITSVDFDVKNDEYPQDLTDFDAIMLSGGAAEDAVYNDVPWVTKLDRFIATIFAESPHVKIFGTCFGHGMVCQSLLGSSGLRVEPNPQGLEIGVKEVKLNDGFLEEFGKQTRKESAMLEGDLSEMLRLQLIHGDHVVVLEAAQLPDGWQVVGSTDKCKVQGMFIPGRVFTLQGHFEFDREINSAVVRHDFGTTWGEERLQKVLGDIDADDDADVAARMILAFFLKDMSECK